MPPTTKQHPTQPLAVRLDKKILAAATKKAATFGISRTKYFEQVLRRDLGMEAVDFNDRESIFS